MAARSRPPARRAFPCLALGLALASCAPFSTETLVLWTDMPEFAVYAQLFNVAQGARKVEAREKRDLARELEAAARTGAETPDIACGRRLASARLAGLWRDAGFLLRNGAVKKGAFYEPLLAAGRAGGEQALLPVSFNLGAVVFLAGVKAGGSGPLIGVEAVREAARAGGSGGAGFSPAWPWNGDFLYAAAGLGGAAFREDASPGPLAWDEAALERALAGLRDWAGGEPGGIAAEDDFVFKYGRDPPGRLLERGRVLFAYMPSDKLFRLPPDELARFDYRWLSGGEGGATPVLDDLAMLGVFKKSRKKRAQTAFVKWFYDEWTQKELLEKSRELRLDETVFGIGGGFSAIRAVTENAFPQAYPALLPRLPPPAALAPGEPLPWNWPGLKERVVIPYLRERLRAETPGPRDLRRRCADWLRMNKQGLSR